VPTTHDWTGYTMGTSYQVKVAGVTIDDELNKRIGGQIDSSLKSVNAQMSTYDQHSEISLLNSNASTKPQAISPEFYAVLQSAINVSKESNGAFDVTVAPLVNLWGFGPKKPDQQFPEDFDIQKTLATVGFERLRLLDQNRVQKTIPELQIDVSAIAKGYGVDVIANLLEAYNLAHYMVEVGGEVRVKGKNAANECWKIGIDKPQHASMPGQNLQGILCLTNVSVATSGDYRNYFAYQGSYYSHTIDPKTGYPVNHNLASVTIITKSCMMADALATATMVLGPERGYEWIQTKQNVEAMLIERITPETFAIKYTNGFEKYIKD
jgi:thiamine biosynthesis lipoprotein